MHVTPEAIQHLQHLRDERGFGPTTGVRFVRKGTRLGLTFVPTPGTGDRIVPRGDLLLFISNAVADAFERSIIDAKTDESRTWLVLRPSGAATPVSH
jgi:hypothetical protein